MKKLAILACVMTVSTGFAMAQQTISIPFFADTNGIAAFVGLQNTGTASITVTTSYLDATGGNGATGGTLTLAAGESISFQPYTTGNSTPNRPDPAPYGFGSITFATSGGTAAGRYVQIAANGSFAHNLEIN